MLTFADLIGVSLMPSRCLSILQQLVAVEQTAAHRKCCPDKALPATPHCAAAFVCLLLLVCLRGSLCLQHIRDHARDGKMSVKR